MHDHKFLYDYMIHLFVYGTVPVLQTEIPGQNYQINFKKVPVLAEKISVNLYPVLFIVLDLFIF
jgi:hypothetical protein